MTGKELIEKMAAILPPQYASKSAAHTFFEAMSRVMREELENGGSVRIPDVGTLKVVERKARPGRNPRTGEPMEIPAGRKITFTPASDLKKTLGGNGDCGGW